MSSYRDSGHRDRRRHAAAWTFAAALALSLALLAASRALPASSSPLALPHREAGLACTSCHGPGHDPKRRCTQCHGSHASLRPAHARLADRGELDCNDCHDVHGQDAGIRWRAAPNPSAVFYSVFGERRLADALHVGTDATVPLVPLSACSQCHDTQSASDPLARCEIDGAAFSTCFDEHRSAGSTPRPAGVCEQNHGAERAWLWEAARLQIQAGSLASPPQPSRGWWWLALLSAPLAFTGHVAWRARRRRAPLGSLLPVGLKRSLPVIDAARCLGCEACVDVCPFDVLRVERYTATVAHPEACCGVATCEQVCPNGSLSFDDGDAVRPARADIDDNGASSAWPGLYLAGDAAGMPLIKNAIAQGERSVRHLAAHLPAHREPLDLLIVGAGPAGLSAALAAKASRLRFLVIEQASVAESIRSFPRGKLVFDQPLNLPLCGPLWMEECTKEELLSKWTYIVRRERLPIREGWRLAGLRRRGGAFVATVHAATDGSTHFIRSARVLLAVGRRGSPRKLGLALDTATQSKVFYHLADAKSFEGKRVVVVGLGDVAIEASAALACQAGTQVTVVHRGQGPGHVKLRNASEFQRLVAAHRLRFLARSEVCAVSPDRIEITGQQGGEALAYDALFVMIGRLHQDDWLEPRDS
jgi:thioredoxin reductase/NAD-dependent dihydropyrimidine dehydrogenase PreA subunit